MSYRLLAAAAMCALTVSRASAQQNVLVGGIVSSAATEQSLPYSTISITGGLRRFTGADGSFSFSLPPGKYDFRVRQLGFAPLDTVINVTAGANLRALVFKLHPVAVTLNAVRTYATSCKTGYHAGDLGGLVDELRKNAEREALLRTEYPFVYELERKSGVQGFGGLTQVTVDTLQYLSQVVAGYKPGDLVQPLDARTRLGAQELRLPTLIDLADTAFIGSHCFTAPGMETLGDSRVYRIDFQPIAEIKGSDVEGSAFIDSSSFLIRKLIIRLTKPEKLRPPVAGVQVVTQYREIFNGLVMFENIHSEQQLNVRLAQVQDQKLIAIKFYGRTPEDIVIAEAPKRNHTATDSTARIAGVVVDSTGRPLRHATILTVDNAFTATSSDSGQFLIKGLKPGPKEFIVRAVGYAPASFTTQLRAGRTRQVRIILSPATVQLSAITVLDSINQPLLAQTGFFERKTKGWGTFMTPDDVRHRNPSNVSDMLRNVPGIEVNSRLPGRTVISSTRSMSVGGRCTMNVFVDGVRQYMSGGMTIEEVIAGPEMAAMEVYPSASEVPQEYIVNGSDCGAIVIWTKGYLSEEAPPDSTKHE